MANLFQAWDEDIQALGAAKASDDQIEARRQQLAEHFKAKAKAAGLSSKKIYETLDQFDAYSRQKTTAQDDQLTPEEQEMTKDQGTTLGFNNGALKEVGKRFKDVGLGVVSSLTRMGGDVAQTVADVGDNDKSELSSQIAQGLYNATDDIRSNYSEGTKQAKKDFWSPAGLTMGVAENLGQIAGSATVFGAAGKLAAARKFSRGATLLTAGAVGAPLAYSQGYGQGKENSLDEINKTSNAQLWENVKAEAKAYDDAGGTGEVPYLVKQFKEAGGDLNLMKDLMAENAGNVTGLMTVATEPLAMGVGSLMSRGAAAGGKGLRAGLVNAMNNQGMSNELARRIAAGGSAGIASQVGKIGLVQGMRGTGQEGIQEGGEGYIAKTEGSLAAGRKGELTGEDWRGEHGIIEQGLQGAAIGGIMAGGSVYSTARNASKLALEKNGLPEKHDAALVAKEQADAALAKAANIADANPNNIDAQNAYAEAQDAALVATNDLEQLTGKFNALYTPEEQAVIKSATMEGVAARKKVADDAAKAQKELDDAQAKAAQEQQAQQAEILKAQRDEAFPRLVPMLGDDVAVSNELASLGLSDTEANTLLTDAHKEAKSQKKAQKKGQQQTTPKTPFELAVDEAFNAKGERNNVGSQDIADKHGIKNIKTLIDAISERIDSNAAKTKAAANEALAQKRQADKQQAEVLSEKQQLENTLADFAANNDHDSMVNFLRDYDPKEADTLIANAYKTVANRTKAEQDAITASQKAEAAKAKKAENDKQAEQKKIAFNNDMADLYAANPDRNPTKAELDSVGKKHGVKSPIELAQAWVKAKNEAKAAKEAAPKLALPSPETATKDERDITVPTGLNINRDNIENQDRRPVIVRNDGQPFQTQAAAEQALKNKSTKKPRKNEAPITPETHKVISVNGGFAIAPTPVVEVEKTKKPDDNEDGGVIADAPKPNAPVSPSGGTIPSQHLDRISRGLKDGKTVEEIATRIQKSLPHLTIEDVTQQVLAAQEKASKPATLDSIIGKYSDDEEVDAKIRQSGEVLKQFLPETIDDWKIDKSTFATRGAWSVSYTKPYIVTDRKTGKEVVNSTTKSAPLDGDVLLSGDEQAIKDHIKERLTKNGITPRGVKDWQLDDAVSPAGQQAVDNTPTQSIEGEYQHSKIESAKATVTKTDKGYDVDWGDEVQSFTGKNAQDKTLSALKSEDYTKQGQAAPITRDDSRSVAPIQNEKEAEVAGNIAPVVEAQHIENGKAEEVTPEIDDVFRHLNSSGVLVTHWWKDTQSNQKVKSSILDYLDKVMPNDVSPAKLREMSDAFLEQVKNKAIAEDSPNELVKEQPQGKSANQFGTRGEAIKHWIANNKGVPFEIVESNGLFEAKEPAIDEDNSFDKRSKVSKLFTWWDTGKMTLEDKRALLSKVEAITGYMDNANSSWNSLKDLTIVELTKIYDKEQQDKSVQNNEPAPTKQPETKTEPRRKIDFSSLTTESAVVDAWMSIKKGDIITTIVGGQLIAQTDFKNNPNMRFHRANGSEVASNIGAISGRPSAHIELAAKLKEQSKNELVKKLIGKTPEGNDLYEDGRGVRFTDNGRGVQVGEDVAITMQNGKTVYDVSGRTDEHRTVEEVAARQPKPPLKATASKSEFNKTFGVDESKIDKIAKDFERKSQDNNEVTGYSDKQPTKKESLLIKIDDELDAALDDLANVFKEQGKRLSSGVDPVILGKVLVFGAKASSLYIAKGAVKFAVWAENMINGLSSKGVSADIVKPYLKQLYLASKVDISPEIRKQMDKEDDVYDFDFAILNENTLQDTQNVTTPSATNGTNVGERDKTPQSSQVQGANESGLAQDDPEKRDDGVSANGGGRGDRGNLSNESGEGNPRGQQSNVASTGDKSPKLANPTRSTESSDGTNLRNYRIQPNELKRTGSWRATAEQNVQIVELVKSIIAENRAATPEEKSLLTKFTGWGASEIANGIFPNQYGQYKDANWKALGERLEAALSPEEYAQAKRTTQYAHYTSEPIIRSVYAALSRFGFNGGSMVEPGMGVGLFNGLMPDAMANNSQYTGIEYDTITGNIAKLLYPDSNVIVGDFTETKLPKNFFDVAIGNPPFGSIKIQSDPEYKKQGFLLHDYFFAKTIDRVKEGGLLVFVTSKGTMDKTNDRARKYLSDRADLVGAIRLPQTAFKDNAGTEVVTDVIFLRKRTAEQEPAGEAWSSLKEISTPQGKASINEYFATHPEMILGKSALTGSMYRANEYTVEPIAGSDIETLFSEAINNLPENIYTPQQGSKAEQAAVQRRDYDPKIKKEGGIYVADDGVLMQVNNGQGTPLTQKQNSKYELVDLSPKEMQWLKDYVGVRDALKQAQYDQLQDNANWQQSLDALNKSYDAFVKKHGFMLEHSVSERENEDGTVTVTKRFKNKSIMGLDAESALINALEQINGDNSISKAPALLGRVINKPSTPVITSTQDAMFVVFNELGRFDLAKVAKLINKSEKDVVAELGDSIYQDPSTSWTTADDYLSGNVVRKLKEAEQAARLNPKYQRNVAALKAVQPPALAPQDINVQLGAAWIPASDVTQFASEILSERFRVNYSPLTGQWSVEGSANYSSEWGIPAKDSKDILEAVLNNRQIKVTYLDANKKTHTDTEKTEKANDIAKKMRESFKRWLWQDVPRTERLVTYYNEHFNNIAPRVFNGEHLTLPGVSSRFDLRPHQKRAIWRTIQQGDVYYAHAVGAGKTFTMIASGMEERRLGLVKKPMYVVPNHMLAQFSKEFLELYPMANIMVADEANFHTHNRRKFVAQAALNNPDAIVITHSAFGRIGMSSEYSAKFIKNQIADWQEALQEVGSDERITRKQIERRIEQLENKLKALLDGAKDQLLNFEELGVDRLYVDEGHEFRKLDFPTNRGSIKGIDPSGSQKSMDLYMKVEYLRGKNPNRSLVMASGTPVTNTMGELFTVQRFFNPSQLEEDGDSRFDAWSAHYGEVVDGLEQNAAGGYETVSRFAKFVNVPELMSRVRYFMDILTSNQLGDLVQRPDVVGGGRQVIVTPAPDGYKDYQKDLERRIKAIRDRKAPPKPGDDIILSVIGDGRFSAIDMRFVDSTLPSDPNSKLNRMLDDLISAYHETANNEYMTSGVVDENKGSSLMLFTDIGLGEQSAKNRGFDMKAWIEKRLVEGGVKREHIAFMRDNKAHSKKEKLFDDMRQGRKRILIGGKDMETGVNAQKRLTHLFHLDAPWFPASVEQREGRIIRQGNQNKIVAIRAYASKGSYDSTMWGMNSRKARFIEQAMSGDSSVRSMEDVSEASAFEMAAALASGDERYLKLAGLKGDVERLGRLYSAHIDEQKRFSREKAYLESQNKHSTSKIEQINEAIAKRKPIKAGEFLANVGKQSFDNREDFSKALFEKFKQVAESYKADEVELGSIAGFPIVYNGIELRGGNFVADLRVDLPIDAEPLAIFPVDPAYSVSGIATRAVNQTNALDKELVGRKSSIEQNTKDLARIGRRIGASFPEMAELNEKQQALNELEQELNAEGKVDDAVSATVDIDSQFNEDKPKFSRGTGEGLTTTQTRAILVKHFGEKVIKALESSGLLTIMATPPSWAEPDADGAYDKDSGKAYLFTDNLSAETVVATLAHELSGHKGFQELMTPTAYASLMRQFNRLVNQGNAIALAAKARAEAAEVVTPTADTKEAIALAEKQTLQRQQDELLPYLLTLQATLNATRSQQSAVTKVIEQVYRAVKAWLYRTLSAHGFDGVASKLLQPKDITLLAERMIREMGNGTNPNSNTKGKSQQGMARRDFVKLLAVGSATISAAGVINFLDGKANNTKSDAIKSVVDEALPELLNKLNPSENFLKVLDRAIDNLPSNAIKTSSKDAVDNAIQSLRASILYFSNFKQNKVIETNLRDRITGTPFYINYDDLEATLHEMMNTIESNREAIEKQIALSASFVEGITGVKLKKFDIFSPEDSGIIHYMSKVDDAKSGKDKFVDIGAETYIKGIELNPEMLTRLISTDRQKQLSAFQTLSHELTHVIQNQTKSQLEQDNARKGISQKDSPIGVDTFIPEGIENIHKKYLERQYEGSSVLKEELEGFNVGYTAAKAWLRKNNMPLRIASKQDIIERLEAAEKMSVDKNDMLDKFGYQPTYDSVMFSQLNTPQTQINAVRRKYEGTSQWMKAPNGQPTKLNEVQWLQVRTPNFKAWFGDWEGDAKNASKVVDANGEPLVVYHGSGADISEFRAGDTSFYGKGVYWTEDITTSDHYAKRGAKNGGNATVYAAFINMRKPMAVSDIAGLLKAEDAAGKSGMSGLIGRLQLKAKRLQFDGVLPSKDENGKIPALAVWNPTQIKSAIGNNGEFNPTNPDIRFSRKAKNPITEGIKSAANDAKNSLPTPIAKSIDNFMAGRRLPSSDMANITAKTELSLYHRTIGTQQNTALQNADFKKVYDMAQRYLQHVAVDAYAALKVAPNLLGKLESWSDLKKDVKKIWPANFIKQKADRAAVASIIFDETLNNELLSDADILKALTRDQRLIYKEARDAIQVSLENTAKSEMVRKLLAAEAINWETVESLINQELPVEQFAQTIRDMVESRIGGFKNELEAILDADPKIKEAFKTGNKNKLIPAQKKELKKALTLKAQIDTTEEALKSLNDVEKRLDTLIEQGYAPLMRFGEYTLTVRDLDGKVKSFFMFESKSEQVRAVNTIVARYGKTVNLETDMISKEEFKQFAGMTPETVALFAKETGMDKDEAYQHYLKHAIPARSAMTRMIKRKGTEGFSDDIQRVVASFVMSNARMSAKNIYAAQIEKSIQAIESGKSVKDQAYVMKENVFNPKENFAQLRNFLFLWNLGGSIFFGLLNMTQPYMQTLPHLSQYVPIKDAFNAIIKGSGIAGSAMKNGTAPKGYEAEYNRAVREGVVDPQNVFMLSGVERGKTGASNSAWGVITHTMGLIAQVTESFNRKAVFIAALEVANKKGAVWLKKKGFNSAYDFAKDTVDQTQGVYDKANRSNWANTSVGAPLMVFKQFSINYVEQMVRMWKKEAASGDEGKKAVFLMLAMLASLSGMMGLPFIKDILDVSETTAAFLGNPVNIEREARLALGKDLADPLFNGVLNHFVFNQMGVDVQSRTSMGDLVPLSNALNPTLSAQGRINEFASIGGATGGLIEKGYDATQLIARGNIGTAALTLMPRSFTSAFTGGKMAVTDEVMDSKGNKLFDTTWDEGLVKFIDANPKRMADLSRTRGLEGKDKAIQAYMTTNFRQKIINAIMDDDKAEVNELMAKVKAWNEARPRYPVFINLNTLSENANKKEQTFDARESIPKGMDWMKNERPEM